MATDMSLFERLNQIEDPRVLRTRLHPLINILVIAVLAALCGAEGWEDMVEFGEAKFDWLSERLDMSNGVPCADTFRRVFERLAPKVLAEVFVAWADTLRQDAAPGRSKGVIALDGKALRHSFDTATNQSAVHVVSVFASDARLVLAQRKVDNKSNEIPAVPELLALLDVKGCVVTADAMHCQKQTAAQIVAQRADYVLCVKDNQPTLCQDIAALFEIAGDRRLTDTETVDCTSTDKGHGRIETRTCRAIELSGLGDAWQDVISQWAGLRCVAQITRTRQIGEKTEKETRYYISSLPASPRRLLHAVRSHWSIENCLHHILDVSFNEDACRVRRDNSPQNLAVIRHIAVNLLRHDKQSKRGIKARRKRAGWDPAYLDHLLTI